MDPLSIALLGAAGFLGYKALTANRAAGAAQSEATRQSNASGVIGNTLGVQQTTIVDPNAQGRAIAQGTQAVVWQLGQSLKDVPVVGAVAPAVAAYMVGGAIAGGKITGDAWGSLAGGLMPVHGNIGNVGRLIGIDIDKMFGGTGTGGTGTVAQVGGFLTALSLLWNVQVFSYGGSAPFFGPVALMAYGIATIVSDIVALNYSQKGRIADFDKEAKRYFLATLSAATQKLLGATDSTGVKITAADLDRLENRRILIANALAVTIGYMRQQNRLLRNIWMRKPRGILFFQSDEMHEKWATDRGVFLTAGNLEGWEKDFVVRELDSEMYYKGPSAVITDAQRNRGLETGRFMSNSEAWAKYLITIPWGALIFDDEAHLKFGLKEGVFEADYIIAAPDVLNALFSDQTTINPVQTDDKGVPLKGYRPAGDTKFMGTWMSASVTKSRGTVACYSPRPIPSELQPWVAMARQGLPLGYQMLHNNNILLQDWV